MKTLVVSIKLKFVVLLTAVIWMVSGVQAGPFEDAIGAYKRGEYQEAYRRWHALAEQQGHAASQYNIGVLYRMGIAVQQDYGESEKWYRMAAEQGHAPAKNGLGFMYDTGKGVPQDHAKAAEWYRQAAEQEFAAAQFNLGLLYEKGAGVPQSNVQAYVWFHAAANSGHRTAIRSRQDVAKKMTAAEISEAHQLAGAEQKKTVAAKPTRRSATSVKTAPTKTRAKSPINTQAPPRKARRTAASRKKAKRHKKKSQTTPPTWRRKRKCKTLFCF